MIEFERAMSITAGEKRALDIFIDATVGGRVVRRLLEAGAFQYDEEPGMLPKIFVPLAAWRVSPWRLPRVILCAGGFGADRSTSPGTALRGQGRRGVAGLLKVTFG